MNSFDANIFRSRLEQSALPEKIVALYIYGSFIKGRLRDESDIDIAMLASYDTNALERLELISKVESIIASLMRAMGLKREISIADLRDKYMSVSLQYRTITEGLLVYERDKNQRVEFENAVKREYFDFEPFLKGLRRRKYGDIYQKV